MVAVVVDQDKVLTVLLAVQVVVVVDQVVVVDPTQPVEDQQISEHLSMEIAGGLVW